MQRVALIGSSTSGFKATDMAKDMKHPERMFVAHPYNPVYLLPLAELVGGEKTSRAVLEDAKAIVVVPDTIKAGFMLGGRRGLGLWYFGAQRPDVTGDEQVPSRLGDRFARQLDRPLGRRRRQGVTQAGVGMDEGGGRHVQPAQLHHHLVGVGRAEKGAGALRMVTRHLARQQFGQRPVVQQ